ncbi:hypothetical protein PYCCODRAFT_1007104 [Trametes coccinea BRFM310]|uniref:Uncharacterized protein n=1 Tax=Trametes coccinea (strain BRFM310) TaxID=1353009 RepID=A0A1Y2ICE7_TRAC3|nr:hypothetical protein PYCCODRAFT_1007104 [Trametes coccinea BRFM310]
MHVVHTHRPSQRIDSRRPQCTSARRCCHHSHIHIKPPGSLHSLSAGTAPRHAPPRRPIPSPQNPHSICAAHTTRRSSSRPRCHPRPRPPGWTSALNAGQDAGEQQTARRYLDTRQRTSARVPSSSPAAVSPNAEQPRFAGARSPSTARFADLWRVPALAHRQALAGHSAYQDPLPPAPGRNHTWPLVPHPTPSHARNLPRRPARLDPDPMPALVRLPSFL